MICGGRCETVLDEEFCEVSCILPTQHPGEHECAACRNPWMALDEDAEQVFKQEVDCNTVILDFDDLSLGLVRGIVREVGTYVNHDTIGLRNWKEWAASNLPLKMA